MYSIKMVIYMDPIDSYVYLGTFIDSYVYH